MLTVQNKRVPAWLDFQLYLTISWFKGGWGMGEQHTYLSLDPAHPHPSELRPSTLNCLKGIGACILTWFHWASLCSSTENIWNPSTSSPWFATSLTLVCSGEVFTTDSEYKSTWRFCTTASVGESNPAKRVGLMLVRNRCDSSTNTFIFSFTLWAVPLICAWHCPPPTPHPPWSLMWESLHYDTWLILPLILPLFRS